METVETINLVDEYNKLKTENEQLREALELVVVYWDEWMDDPDNDPTALCLEEVVSIARATLGGRD
jgi:hypothetical protein